MKILICVPVYNRKDITELVLDNLNKNKKDATLFVYNDWSTEYDNEFLEPYCDKVFKLDKSDKVVVKNESNKNGQGVQHLRWFQFRQLVNEYKEFDAIYFTDSDAIHDPDYIDILKENYKKYSLKDGRKLPICLYNTKWHTNSLLKESNDVMMRKTAPGISQLFDREMCEKIVKVLDHNLEQKKEDPNYGWDYIVSDILKIPFLTTKTSYVEHYGAVKGSMHTEEGQWDRDRALTPTEYLQKNRLEIISYLENKGEKPKI